MSLEEEMMSEARWVKQRVRKHHDWFEQSLPMIASENHISPLARELILSDFMDRYAEGLPGERYYNGNTYVDEVELKCEELTKRLFDAPFADVRCISATIANLAVLKAYGKHGDTITVPALADGAHISSARFGAVGVRGLKRVEYPFNPDTMNLDIDGTIKAIREAEPKICLFGRSVFLFPPPLSEFQDVIRETGAVSWYDGAHVMGLIAGKQWQDPIREGMHVLTGSTHKTLPGPQRALVLGNFPEDVREKREKSMRSAIFPALHSNHHLHTMAALCVTLAEHIAYGQDYAKQVIANAQALGGALAERGFNVMGEKLGFTRSHTLAVDVREHGGGREASDNLEAANLICNKNMMPGDKSPINPSGLRFGSQELTRLGMKETDMQSVAEIIRKVVIDKVEPKKVAEEVKELRSGFTGVQYCFKAGEKAHKFYELFPDWN